MTEDSAMKLLLSAECRVVSLHISVFSTFNIDYFPWACEDTSKEVHEDKIDFLSIHALAAEGLQLSEGFIYTYSRFFTEKKKNSDKNKQD